MQEFVEHESDAKIAYLTADGRSIGCGWLDYLLSQTMMLFGVRIRENNYLCYGQYELQTRIVFIYFKIGKLELLKRKSSL